MGRSPCCSKVGLRRGPWSAKEDSLLTDYIQKHGEGHWRSLPKNAGLLRCGKSCRLRWMNYLRPGIKRGNISEDEEDLIVRLHGLLGNRWSLIAGRLPGRTDNEIKNYWNTHLFKKLNAAGVLPVPRRGLPKSDGGKKTERKKVVLNNAGEADVNAKPEKTKVYLPKPLRVSSEFSRSNSSESLVSGASGDQAVEAVVEWPPLFEVEGFGVYSGGGGGEHEDFLGSEYGLLPELHHLGTISGEVEMLDKVYDEYLQLL